MTKILLANPRGFCAGVDRAIEIVERALELFGAPIYVRHEVVHNTYVVKCLRDMGAVFVEELDEVPEAATVIFSAHGVSQQIQQVARSRGLKVFDATCPLVTKVHLEVARYARDNKEVILIGHAGHPEVEGTMGQYVYQNEAGTENYENKGIGIYLVETVDDVVGLTVNNPEQLAYVTQTTLSMDDTSVIVEALRKRFPLISGPKKSDICYATQNRQDSVKSLAQQSDMVLVVGSSSSSNSNRLREIAEQQGVSAYLIDTAEDIQDAWLDEVNVIGITAGASAPEVLVEGVIANLKQRGAELVQEDKGQREKVVFALPQELNSL